MLKSLLIGLYLLFGYLQISSAQSENKTFKESNNYFSLQAGLAYPFYSPSSSDYNFNTDIIHAQYTFSDIGINYGFYAGLGYGHLFGKLFSMTICPSLMYSKYSNTNFYFEVRTPVQQALISESEGIFHFSHVSFVFPLDFSFRINKIIDGSIGGLILKPISDWEYSLRSGVDYLYYNYNKSGYHSYQPPRTYTNHESKYKNYRSFGREGLHVQVSFKFKERDWQQQRVIVDYYYSLTESHFDVHEQWIRVGFTKLLFQ